MVAALDIEKIRDIRHELIYIANREACKLYRIARKAEKHRVSLEIVTEIRKEASNLYVNITAYPERLLETDRKWKYAFR